MKTNHLKNVIQVGENFHVVKRENGKTIYCGSTKDEQEARKLSIKVQGEK